MIGFALQICNLISLQFLPESPRLLVELGRLDEAKAAFQKIAKWNGKELHWCEAYFKRTENLNNFKKSETGYPLSFWLKQKRVLTNVIVMTVIWLTTSFSFYLISFLLTHFGQVYTTTMLSSVSDLAAYTFAGNVFKCLGVKKTYFLGYTISSIGGLILLFFGLNHQTAWYFPAIVLFARFGVALSFGVNYISNSFLFPTLFAATAIGLCNCVARSFTTISPILAQMDEPLPMILFTSA